MNYDRRRMMVALGLCLSAALPAAAQTDVEGSRDYGGFDRVSGFYISAYSDTRGGAFDFRVADDTYKRIGGHYYLIQYAAKEGATTPAAGDVGRILAVGVAARRGATLRERLGSIGGSVTANWQADGRSVWIQAEINNSGASYTLNVVEEDATTPDVEFTAAQLGQMLDQRGVVAVRSIAFDSETAVITAQSAAVLSQIAELLGSREELRLEIQGHSEDMGGKVATQALSAARAAAVKDYLVTFHQTTAAQLITSGSGDPRPVGDPVNGADRTATGRIDLVKKS
ncbi:MAG: OmpA family protein [Acidobacteriota bacterium]